MRRETIATEEGGTVAKIAIHERALTDKRVPTFTKTFERRIQATPPGTCPLALQVSLLEASGAQTCGKCVPCRDGIPQLAEMLRQIRDCSADESVYKQAKSLATMIRDTSDCAIGYEAGNYVLQGMESFADEYASHLERHRCLENVGQSVPCETMCPAHVNVPGYIALIAKGDPAGAIAMIRKDNPFPTSCAYVCEHPCESRCRRTIIDAPINIRGLKHFAVDQVSADEVPTPKRNVATGRRVAVVGGGPSGMTCAYYLALMGHEVDVYEQRKALGGMMRYGIPAYRFPREELDHDLAAILEVGGITIHAGTQVDAAKMREIADSHDACYVSIGAHRGKTLRLDHIDAEGVSSAVELLRGIGDGDYPDFSGKDVIVIGGGNVAMDCARTSVRLGAKSVSVVYRRRREDMTALPAEIESAVAEGVEMLTLLSPASLEVDGKGHVSALIAQPQIIGPEKGGRPAPRNADQPEQRLEAQVVLVAVGQDIASEPFVEFGFKAERGRLQADEYFVPEGLEGTGIFTGGECVTGPATVIRAIGAGKVAARNIDEYLGYHHKLNIDVETPDATPNDRTPMGRVEVTERTARERKRDFECTEKKMTLEEAMQECGRCLRCDHYGCGITEGGRTQYV